MLTIQIKVDKNGTYNFIFKTNKPEKNIDLKLWAILFNEIANNTENFVKSLGQHLSSKLTKEQEEELAYLIVDLDSMVNHTKVESKKNINESKLEEAKKPVVPPRIMVNKGKNQ